MEAILLSKLPSKLNSGLERIEIASNLNTDMSNEI